MGYERCSRENNLWPRGSVEKRAKPREHERRPALSITSRQWGRPAGRGFFSSKYSYHKFLIYVNMAPAFISRDLWRPADLGKATVPFRSAAVQAALTFA